MTFFVNSLFSMSIILPALTGAIKARRFTPVYYPFLVLIWLGLVIEIAGTWLALRAGNNLILYNFFSVAEALLITWQFKRWRLFDSSQWMFRMILVMIGGSWIADHYFTDPFKNVNSYFIILSSFMIVMLSIHLLTDRMFIIRRSLFKDPLFLISLGFIIYFLYSIVVEILWLYGLAESTSFRLWVLDIFAYINLITNCIYAFAILCIPLQPRYMIQW